MIKSINPTNEEIVKSYETHSEKGIEKIINSADKSWHHWRSTSFMHRSQLMQNLSSLLKSKKEELAHLMALEMGKVKREGMSFLKAQNGEFKLCKWSTGFGN